MLLEYDGTGYSGWQRQEGVLSIQAILEDAAARVCGGPVTSFVAGRTDAGVHAAAQVAMLSMPAHFTGRTVRDSLNYHIKPHPVAVLCAAPAAEGWNPRFSAIGRSYRYTILNRRARPTLLLHRVWHVPAPLDVAAMADAARLLLGRHDFTSFRAAACQARSPLRTLDRLDVVRDGDAIAFIAEARSFLHHQVRNMVGTLVQVGNGRWTPDAVGRILSERSRAAAGPTAPPGGLVMTGVRYPADPFGSSG